MGSPLGQTSGAHAGAAWTSIAPDALRDGGGPQGSRAAEPAASTPSTRDDELNQAAVSSLSAAIAEAVINQISPKLTGIMSPSIDLAFRAHEERMLSRIHSAVAAALQPDVGPDVEAAIAANGADMRSCYGQSPRQKGVSSDGQRQSTCSGDVMQQPSGLGCGSMNSRNSRFKKGGGGGGGAASGTQAEHGTDSHAPSGVWNAVKKFVRGPSERDKVMGPPALDQLQDACADNLFSVHHIGCSERKTVALHAVPRPSPTAASKSPQRQSSPACHRRRPSVPGPEDHPAGSRQPDFYFTSDRGARAAGGKIAPEQAAPDGWGKQEQPGQSDAGSPTGQSPARGSKDGGHSPARSSGDGAARAPDTPRGDAPGICSHDAPGPDAAGECQQPQQLGAQHASDALDSTTPSTAQETSPQQAPEAPAPSAPHGLARQRSSDSDSLESVRSSPACQRHPSPAGQQPGLASPDASFPESRHLQRRHTDSASMPSQLPQYAGVVPTLVGLTSSPRTAHSWQPPGLAGDLYKQGSARQPCTPGPVQPTSSDGFGSLLDRLRHRLSEQLSGAVDEEKMLRQAREEELLSSLEYEVDTFSVISGDNITSGGSAEGLPGEEGPQPPPVSYETLMHCASPLPLRIWGILPWDGASMKDSSPLSISRWRLLFSPSLLYQRAIVVLAAAAVAFSIDNLMVLQRAAFQEAETGTSSTVLCFQELVDLIMAAGSLLGLVLLRRSLVKHNLLGSSTAMLVGYAKRERLLLAWSHVTGRETPRMVLLWLLVVIARACSAPSIEVPVDDLLQDALRRGLSTCLFAFSSGLILTMTYTCQHVVVLLPMMVDGFCFHFVHRPILDRNVRDWSLLQAALRRASNAVERCFLVLETTTLIVVLTSVTAPAMTPLRPLLHSWLLLSVMLIAGAEARLFFNAAEVTEKCHRVPSLVNSMCFGSNVDADRHYLVQYVSFSAAGFYVFQVRLTAAMALKLTYVSGLCAFAVITNIAAQW